jgi:hypothetical protein
LGSIGRLFRPSGLAAGGMRLKDLETDSCALEASRPRLRGAALVQALRLWRRSGALRSARFWLALALISGWVGQAAMSQQIQQQPSAMANTGAPAGYGRPPGYAPPPGYGAPPSYRAPPSIRPGGRISPAGQPKFDPADLPVLVRPRPELDPLGVRLGSFLAFPELRISEFYDDNILFSDSNAKDDFVTEIAPLLGISSDWNEDLLSFEARAAIGRYAQNTNQNYEDYGTSLRGRFWVTDTSYIDQEFSYDRRHSNRESPDDTTSVHPTEYDDLLGNAGFFQQLGRFTLRLDGTFRRLDYLDDEQITGGVVTPIDNGDRDRNQIGGTARIGYLIRPDIETYLQAGYGIIRYDTSPDDNGFQRDANTYNAIVGIAKDWNGIFEADVYLGYLAQTFDDPRFDTIDGIDFGGKLAWNVTRRTTLSALAGRRISVTTLDNAAGSLVTEAGVVVDHELRRDLLLYFNAKWRESDYSGIDRTDDTYEIGVGANYFVMRNFTVGAGYSYRQRDSNAATADYTRNLVTLNLDLRF